MGENGCVYIMVESPCYSPETITTLLMSSTKDKIKNFFKNKYFKKKANRLKT